jgi:hypothetical protein
MRSASAEHPIFPAIEHANRSLANLLREPALPCHRSILSSNGASDKPGVVHAVFQGWAVRYQGGPLDSGRYSPPVVVSVKKDVVFGSPDMELITTSHVERQNLTMRTNIRRLTRLTNGFSKKVENLRAAVALHFAAYNFVRVHGALKTTPAIPSGVSDRRMTLAELAELPY